MINWASESWTVRGQRSRMGARYPHYVYKELHGSAYFCSQLPGRIVFDYKQLSSNAVGAKAAAYLPSTQAQFWREVGTLRLMAIEPVGIPCKNSSLPLPGFSVVVVGFSLSAGQVAARWDFFGGYSYLRFESTTIGYANRSNLNGFIAELSYNFTPSWTLTADGSGHYGAQLTLYTFMAGPQYTLRRDKS